MTRGSKVTVKCKNCKQDFEARVADRKRGWAKFCSKSCKAVNQEKRTGQYTKYLMNDKSYRKYDPDDDQHPHDPYSLGQE